MNSACPTFDALNKGGKLAMAFSLAEIETHPDTPEVLTLLDEAWAAPKAHVLGLTGPPGVGKSTLLNVLINKWRAAGKTVGVIAVDPSSRKTGGALLGDRTRLSIDPGDEGVFVRSMAARDRLGGLAALTYPASVLMRSVYDIVVIETVGVGQSETEISNVADTVVFCVQPGSGDSLQFMKAGVMEMPDLAVVTKADMGADAIRARADVKGALSLSRDSNEEAVPVMMVSASQGEGIDALTGKIEERWHALDGSGDLDATRRQAGLIWLREMIEENFGKKGWLRLQSRVDSGRPPFAQWQTLSAGEPT
jgi:LAO/AO transport system kinase